MANGLPTTFQDLFIKAVALGLLKYDFFDESDFAYLKVGVIPGRKSSPAEAEIYLLHYEFDDFLLEQVDPNLSEENYQKYLTPKYFKSFIDYRNQANAKEAIQVKTQEQQELEEWGLAPDNGEKLNQIGARNNKVPQIVESGLRFRGDKIDLIRILNALWESRMVVNETDDTFPTKSAFMKKMGSSFGIDLSKYYIALSQAFKEGTLEANIAIFEQLKEATTNFFIAKDNQK